MPTGYSDRINHAFAFAAKHHDRQVRQGTRPPYQTQPANVAVILTRYGQDEETVLAGILSDALDGTQRESYTREMIVNRIREKFGDEVLETAKAVTIRASDDEGNDFDAEERRDDFLERVAAGGERARWVTAAAILHNAGALLAELRRTQFPETVWSRLGMGREGTIAWYRRVHERLHEVGFRAPILDELRTTVEALEGFESAQATGPATR